MVRGDSAVRVAAAAVGMALVAGCSSAVKLADSASADLSRLGDKALHSRVDKAVGKARYVRITGTIRARGVLVEVDTHMDMEFGEYTTVTKTMGLTIETVSVESNVFIKAPRAYWQQVLGPARADLAAELDGKYGRMAADDPTRSKLKASGLAINPRTIVNDVMKTERRPDRVLEGRRMVVLAERDQDSPGLVFIPAEGPALPYRMSARQAGEESTEVTVTWTEYGRPSPVRRPGLPEVVDLPRLPTLGKLPGTVL
ncbi:hypothetical protein [Embleya sp. AB8]|uniref:hypothetical protein n=1 Tax=Embleya sp. AB8 TaxID=3156304 RepID=UPI003C712985